MISELGELATDRLNLFPAKNGISLYYSPETIMTGRVLDYNKHCTCKFGAYVQAHHQNNPTNTMTERTIDDIYMRPNDNGAGSHASILENAKKFVEKRGDKSYYIRGTFTQNNLDFAKDVEYLAKQGFEQLSIEPVVAEGKMSYSLKPEDIENIKKEYEELAKWYLKYRKDTFVNFFHFMINLEDGPCLIKRLSGCGAGFEYVAVTPEGDVYPCHQYVGMEEMKMATVDDETIDRQMAEKFAANNVVYKPECQKCWAQFWCGGGCGANAYKYNGDLNKPYEMECGMLKKRLECAMAIYALEKDG
jgi:uncharacterized protein